MVDRLVNMVSGDDNITGRYVLSKKGPIASKLTTITRPMWTSLLAITTWLRPKLTIPQALQLCFFLIRVNGVPQSMHFWIESILRRRGCFLPISDSRGRSMSRPILSEDFFWYSSLIVWKRASSHSSFSALVLKEFQQRF